jgi:hypothetical protein
VAETHFDEWIAERHDVLWPELLDPSLLDAAVDVLADLAGEGSALEFGIGTGRLAVPLAHGGVSVHGINHCRTPDPMRRGSRVRGPQPHVYLPDGCSRGRLSVCS